MLTADLINESEADDPVVYTRDKFAKFAEILHIIEEEKANFEGESLIYFHKFADKLIENYLNDCFGRDEDGLDDPILDERKANLDNEEDQMMVHADMMRALMTG